MLTTDANYTSVVSTDGTTVTNTLTTHYFSVSKVDATKGTKIEGATLQILDSNNKVLHTWKSVADADESVSLPAGTYTLYESAAPNGYSQAQRIPFTIATDGTVTSTTTGAVSGNKIVMKDTTTNKPNNPYHGPDDDSPKTNISFSKVDAAATAVVGVAGATYSIEGTSDEGKAVSFSFTTNGDGTITESGTTCNGLSLPDGTYTITETQAPKGYDLADPVKITVSATGVAIVSGDATSGTDSTVYLAENLTKRTITVSKVDATDGATEIAGAKLSITGSTVNGTKIDTISWTSEAGKSKTVELAAGTYTLHEDAAPAGYDLAQDIEFTVDASGTVTSAGKTLSGAKVVMSDSKTVTPTTPTSGNSGSSNSTSSKSATSGTPKTGDTSTGHRPAPLPSCGKHPAVRPRGRASREEAPPLRVATSTSNAKGGHPIG